MRRLLMIFAISALATSALALGLAEPAWASTTSCSTVGGNIHNTVALSACNDVADTGGSGTFPGASLTTGSGTVTWNGTGTTTLSSITMTAVTPNACAPPRTEYQVNGVVTGGTGVAKKSIKTGYTFQAFVCVKPNGHIKLLAGQLFNFGPTFSRTSVNATTVTA